MLKPTFDYTHSLLDFAEAAAMDLAPLGTPGAARVPHVTAILDRDGLIEPVAPDDTPAPDLTREPLELPSSPRAAPAGPGARG